MFRRSSAVVWTGVSVILLIASIGGMVWFYAGWHQGTRGARYAGRRSSDRCPADAVAKGDGQIFSGRLTAVSASDHNGDDHGALRRRGRRIVRHSAAGLSSRTSSRERGTRSSAFSGSQRRGSPPGFLSLRTFADTSRRNKSSASTFCSVRC